MTDNDLLHRLDMATIASCSCQTKTPELRDHDPMCWYRLFSEAASELRDLQQTFDLQWEADMRAVRQWREAHPGNEVLLMPDRANMVVWLLERLDAALAATPAVGGEITDAMVNAVAREMWNDRDARHGGSWDERDPREVCVIQTKATAKAALKAALRAAQPASPLRGREISVHLSHCNQGEYLGSCKYGDDDCPTIRSTVLWPYGCHDPDSCARHKACMYIQCLNNGRDIAGEVEASISQIASPPEQPAAPAGHEICSACGRMFKWGETCTRGGCPCGGDV